MNAAKLALWRSKLAWRTRRWEYWRKKKNTAYTTKWNALRLEAVREINRLKKTGPTVMYDSVTISQIPAHAEAVAGYVDGKWPTYKALLTAFPKAHHLSIAVNSTEDAECLDVEPGDATPAQAAAWVKRQKARGVKRPVVYTSISQAQSLVYELAKAGVSRQSIRLWTAHYTYHPHRCSAVCGYNFNGIADGTQWTDKSLGRNLDESRISPTFFD